MFPQGRIIVECSCCRQDVVPPHPHVEACEWCVHWMCERCTFIRETSEGDVFRVCRCCMGRCAQAIRDQRLALAAPAPASPRAKSAPSEGPSKGGRSSAARSGKGSKSQRGSYPRHWLCMVEPEGTQYFDIDHEAVEGPQASVLGIG